MDRHTVSSGAVPVSSGDMILNPTFPSIVAYVSLQVTAWFPTIFRKA